MHRLVLRLWERHRPAVLLVTHDVDEALVLADRVLVLAGGRLAFSGPVDVPGVTLPAGTYRFSLADPETGRRVIKVADKDGTKMYGMFISIPNERLTPTEPRMT